MTVLLGDSGPLGVQAKDLANERIDVKVAVPTENGFVGITWKGSIVVVEKGAITKGRSRLDGPFDPWKASRHPFAVSPTGDVVVADRKAGLVLATPPTSIRATLQLGDVDDVQWCANSFWVITKSPERALLKVAVKGDAMSAMPGLASGEKAEAMSCNKGSLTVISTNESARWRIWTLSASGSVGPIPAELSKPPRSICSCDGNFVLADQFEIRFSNASGEGLRRFAATPNGMACTADSVVWTDGVKVFRATCDGLTPEQRLVAPYELNIDSLAAGSGKIIWVHQALGKVVGVDEASLRSK